MRDEDNNGGMTINENKDQKQNYQRWKHLQLDQTRLVNEENGQKVYQGQKPSWLDEMVNSIIGSEENQK